MRVMEAGNYFCATFNTWSLSSSWHVKIYKNNMLFVKRTKSVNDAKKRKEQVSETLGLWKSWITRVRTLTNREWSRTKHHRHAALSWGALLGRWSNCQKTAMKLTKQSFEIAVPTALVKWPVKYRYSGLNTETFALHGTCSTRAARLEYRTQLKSSSQSELSNRLQGEALSGDSRAWTVDQTGLLEFSKNAG